MTPASRRHFLLSLAGLGALAADSARAADGGDYRALVCLFLNGGNDAHNWIVPTDRSGHAEYARVRGELAWPLDRLLGLSATGQASGRTFGLAPELAPLRSWYESGQLAVLANVGPLVRPITKAEYAAGGPAVPTKLYSHNDQQSIWQSLAPEGSPSGWGGRMADLLQSGNGRPLLTAVSASGNAVFLNGRTVQPYHVGADGPLGIAALERDWTLWSARTPQLLRRTILAGGSSPFHTEYVRVTQRSLDMSALLRGALAATPIAALPTTPIVLPSGGEPLALDRDALARQLRVVAQLVAAGPGLGLRRQVFMVSLGGFDTHAHQLRDHPRLGARVAHALDWFLASLRGAGLLDRVTLFTASDFGRTLTSNGDGSDHGWGSHHLIAGGAVKGRAIYGTFPVTALGTATDVDNGRLLPTTSVTEYAATLGRWMGLGTADLTTVLPNLGHFASTDLGFLA